MKSLLRFELRKILCRKVNLIALALGLLLVIVSNIVLITGESLYVNEETSLEGVEAIKTQSEIENALASELSEEFLTGFLQDYRKEIQNQPLGYDFFLIAPKISLYSLIASNYVEWNQDWDWECLGKIRKKSYPNA